MAPAIKMAAAPMTPRRPFALAPFLRMGVLVSTAALAGCAVGPDYTAPTLELPAKWSRAPRASNAKVPWLGEWWTKLGDRALNAIVEEAVEGNLDVASAKARVREARASRRQAVGALFPTLDGTGAATRTRSGGTSVEQNLASSGKPNVTSNTFQAGFDASFEADLFGANYRNVEAATYGVDAADEDLRSTLLTLIGDVTSYYVEARGYQARIDLARRTAKSQRETESLTRTKFEAGSASALDTSRASAQAAATEATIPTLETAYQQSVNQLSILTGRPPTALAARLARTAPIPVARSNPPAGIPADVLLNRPDVRRAERQLAQATAKIGNAEAQLYPAVSLTGSIDTSGFKTNKLLRNTAIGWSFGPSLSVPIFNGGELRAAVDVAAAQRDQYDSAFRLSVLTALQDVENALVALSQERVRTTKLSASATSYREAARLSRTLYQTGSSSFLDVLDAERSLYSAEDTLLQSRVDQTTDFIALNKALGGGWTRPVDASVPAVIDVNTGPHLRAGF